MIGTVESGTRASKAVEDVELTQLSLLGSFEFHAGDRHGESDLAGLRRIVDDAVMSELVGNVDSDPRTDSRCERVCVASTHLPFSHLRGLKTFAAQTTPRG